MIILDEESLARLKEANPIVRRGRRRPKVRSRRLPLIDPASLARGSATEAPRAVPDPPPPPDEWFQ